MLLKHTGTLVINRKSSTWGTLLSDAIIQEITLRSFTRKLLTSFFDLVSGNVTVMQVSILMLVKINVVAYRLIRRKEMLRSHL